MLGSRLKQCASSLLLVTVWGASALGMRPEHSVSKATKRPITVADAIALARLADADYFGGLSSTGRVAHFSSDGKRFVVIVRKGNLAKNTNEYSIYLFQVDQGLFRQGRAQS